MPKIPDGEWTLDCDAALFASLRGDKEFTFLLTLARCVNVLKFSIDTHPTDADLMTPAAERARLGSFIVLAGTIHELLDLRDRLEAEWGGLTAYRDVFSVFDSATLDARTVKLLSNIRNRAAFHFDPSIAQRVLPTLPAEPFTFLSAIGKKRMESNYDLADLVTVGFLFESPRDMERLGERGLEILDRLLSLAHVFIRKADRMLMQRLLARGFRIVQHPSGTFAGERKTD